VEPRIEHAKVQWYFQAVTKLASILALLVFACTCSAATTTHHWFAKVPANRSSGKSKSHDYKVKVFKGGKSRSKSAILTRVHTN
jgi:hypothetical protein